MYASNGRGRGKGEGRERGEGGTRMRGGGFFIYFIYFFKKLITLYPLTTDFIFVWIILEFFEVNCVIEG